MHVTVSDIVDIMEDLAPISLAESWDNVGLMLGRSSKQVQRILLALDMTPATVQQARACQADLLLTHHPAVFKKLEGLTDRVWQQELLLSLAESGIAVYSAHTNLDSAQGGVNDVLAQCLQLQEVTELDASTQLGRIGCVEECSLEGFAAFVKKQLHAPYLNIADAGRPVHRVAICGGAGTDLIPLLLGKNVDTFVTGDVKYHTAQEAVFGGLNIIDAGHQATELPVLKCLAAELEKRFAAQGWQVTITVAQEEPLLKSI